VARLALASDRLDMPGCGQPCARKLGTHRAQGVAAAGYAPRAARPPPRGPSRRPHLPPAHGAVPDHLARTRV